MKIVAKDVIIYLEYAILLAEKNRMHKVSDVVLAPKEVQELSIILELVAEQSSTWKHRLLEVIDMAPGTKFVQETQSTPEDR